MSRTTYTENDLRLMQERIAAKNKVQLNVSARAEKKAPVNIHFHSPTIENGAIKILVKPMSVNEAWKGKRFKSVAYMKYQKRVSMLLPHLILNATNLKVSLEFGFSNKASDIDNPTKQVLDILSKKYHFDDREIYEMNLKKVIVKKGEEYFSFKIESL